MISRKIVIAAGAATVAGALSATLAFAAENGASLALSDSGTSSSLSASGSAFGGSAGGSLGSNGGSFTVSLPDAPSVPTPDVDSLMDHMRSGAQELASDIQAAATGVWNQGESAGDKLRPAHLFNPVLNIELGTAYLSQLMERFDGDLQQALIAYNAGPATARSLRRGTRAWKRLATYPSAVLSAYKALLQPPEQVAAR